MSASEEVRKAAATLRKAAQLKRDELRNTHSQLGRVKNDHERLLVAMRQEEEAIKQSQNDRTTRAVPRLRINVGDVNRRIGDLSNNHQKEISELEEQINKIDQEITQFENQASELERIA